MPNLHKVNIVGSHKIYVDDRRVNGVKRICTTHEAGSLPSVEIEVIPSIVDVETLSDVNLEVSVESLRDAIMCIQLSLKLDDDFRNAIKAGIDSVLRDYRNAEPDIGLPDESDAIMEVIFNYNYEQ